MIINDAGGSGNIHSRDASEGGQTLNFSFSNGITIADATVLEGLLMKQAMNEEVTKELTTPFGKKFIFESTIEFPNRKAHRIRSVWIQNRNENVIKFVTAYKIA